MNQKNYKPDIDGLRAIAVLGVILYHAGLPVSGGYVGVDVFFVISGYLITQIIVRESAESKFTMVNFWKRRILRILPAATAVSITTLVAGYFILDQTTFSQAGKSALAQALMVANIFFWKSSGYFAESAELQPLLHTWSLAVEEQFYLFLPLALTLFLRRGRYALHFLTLLTLASFTLSVHGTINYPSATFFILPTRAWELSAGGLLAMCETRLRFRKSIGEVMALLGLIAIVIPMLIYTKHTSFPGLGALPPVLGAVVLIAANRNGTTLVGKWLSSKYTVAIGLASYSLYLWHWPVLVYFKHVFVNQTGLHVSTALGLTMILSLISWKYIENPFRSSPTLKKHNTAFYFGASLTSLTVACGAIVWIGQGLPSRMPSEQMAIHSDITWWGEEYESDNASGVRLGAARDHESPPDFYLWGDSHGMVMSELVDKLASDLGISGVGLLSHGVAPVTGLWKPLQSKDNQQKATTLNNARLDAILDSGTKDVILAGRWDGMVNGLLPTEVDELRGIPSNFNMVVDSTDETPCTTTSKLALGRQLNSMLKTMESRGIRVWLVIQVPSCTRPMVARDFYVAKRFPNFNQLDFKHSTSMTAYQDARSDSMDVFHSMNCSNLVIVDPIDAFYGPSDHLVVFEDRAYYRDEDHLTRPGAAHYMTGTVNSILRSIKSGKVAKYER